MTRAAAIPLAAAALAALAGCNDARKFECAAGPTDSATCEQACNNLFDIHCRVGKDREECIATCLSTTGDGATTDVASFGRVLFCYTNADSCDDVNACSLGCGPMNTPVPFIGSSMADAGPTCDDDSRENDDTTGTATAAGVPSSNPGTACPADADFVSFGVGAGSTYTVTLTFAAGTATLTVLDSSGGTLGDAGEGTSPRTVSFTASAADTAFARVVSAAGAGDYTLEIASP